MGVLLIVEVGQIRGTGNVRTTACAEWSSRALLNEKRLPLQTVEDHLRTVKTRQRLTARIVEKAKTATDSLARARGEAHGQDQRRLAQSTLEHR
jgi:hypothetical protein